MPLDPTIPLRTTVPQVQSPIRTLGALAQLRAYQAQEEENRLQTEARRRALEDDAYTREALTRHAGNPDRAIDELYQTGRYAAAHTLSEHVLSRRKAMGEALKNEQETFGNRLTFSSQILQSATDQASYNTALAAIEPLWGDDPRWPQMKAWLGPTYDKAKADQAILWGTDTKTVLEQRNKAIELANKAWELGLQQGRDWQAREKNQREAREYYQQSASQLLSTARSQEEWDQFQRTLASEGGVPIDILAQFGNRFSPEALQRARDLGMTQKERSDAAHQKVSERQRERQLDIYEQRVQRDPQAAITSRAELTRRAAAERWRQGALKSLETGITEGKIDPATKRERKREIEASYRLQIGAPTAEDAEAWKARDYADLEDDDALSPEEKATQKLGIEDDYRSHLGLPPLLETEFALSADPSKAADLAKVRKTYKDLTGEDTLLARIESLTAKIKTEKDQTKQRALAAELKTLRDRYRQQTGR